MASSPSYNPNLVENHFGGDQQITADCKPAAPLVNRATAGSLPAGLDVQGRHGLGGARVEPASRRTSDVRRPRLLHRLREARQQLRHEPAVRDGSRSRRRSSTPSTRCSATSARRSARSGSSTQAKKFGFYERPPLETPDERAPTRAGSTARASSTYPKRNADVDAGRMAFGQERLLVTPLQMAMVAGTIGNDGILMRPYVVEKIVSPRRQDGRRRRGRRRMRRAGRARHRARHRGHDGERGPGAAPARRRRSPGYGSAARPARPRPASTGRTRLVHRVRRRLPGERPQARDRGRAREADA